MTNTKTNLISVTFIILLGALTQTVKADEFKYQPTNSVQQEAQKAAISRQLDTIGFVDVNYLAREELNQSSTERLAILNSVPKETPQKHYIAWEF